ncbi:MAG: adenylosuccinate synthase [Halobacteriaceae archaeon]
MTATIVGAQLGDEGKGGVVDLLGDAADIVVRYQGGDNAGHTVVHDDDEFKLSLIPSGCVRGRTGVLGNGCVLNPRTLFEELDGLRERGLDPTLKVAKRAHVILPLHRELDGIEEADKDEADQAVGTTGRGIGPTYQDKVGRRGIRVADLLDPARLRDRLEYLVPQKRRLATEGYGREVGEAFDIDAIHREYADYGRRLRDRGMVVDAGAFLARKRAAGATLLLEGAQGSLLDIDHGNYPYVTSSNPSAGFAATGSGLPPSVIGRGAIVGVVKAYTSRVGEGPLPTELSGEPATLLRERGGEYGTVTGRPRRVGWLDLSMLRHAARVSGFTDIALNHIDVLAGLEEVRVATAYEFEGERLETIPAASEDWAACEPIYDRLEGWADVDWEHVAEAGWSALPAGAKRYVETIESAVGVDVSILGVGPERGHTIVRNHPLRD